MIAAKLREAITDRPFKPFTIVMGDGSRYRVTHPEMIAIAPKAERTFIVAYGEEEHAVLELPLVTALQFGDSSRSSRNGTRKSK